MKICPMHFIWALLVLGGCSGSGIFGPRSPHRQYAESLEKAGLAQSALGKKWIEAGEKCLNDSIIVSLPYRESGFFAANVPQSSCIRFKPKRGQKITVSIQTRPSSGIRFFAELWRAPAGHKDARLLLAADSALHLEYEQDDNEILLLRLQPELLVSVSYTVTVVADPTLAFPVPGNDGTKVGSFWGDSRDGGKRSHEGVDIFDAFRTPVVASCDGIIMRVNENRLGGKCVWLNPSGKAYMLYYAHLDSQIAKPLQQVNTGDTLGLMGNTGNAKHTPTHLHFGIYENGAIDPLPFIQQVDKTPDAITGDTSLLNTQMRVIVKQTKLLLSPQKQAPVSRLLDANTLLSIAGAAGNHYRVTLPDGQSGFVPVKLVGSLTTSIKQYTSSHETELLADAESEAAVMQVFPTGTAFQAYALFDKYIFVKHDNKYGWIYSDGLQPVK
jgi:murein DD-endopeptidase MepM/ murein hydrolase activator NlpD